MTFARPLATTSEGAKERDLVERMRLEVALDQVRFGS
jgi:hypothetical protein